jgi:hypothetical protein
MRRIALTALFSVACLPVWADHPTPTAPGDPEPGEIIRKFAAKEAEFARARANYTYRQSVTIQELDQSGSIRGRYHLVEDIIFAPDGRRTERVVRAPVSTLRNILLTPEDQQDLRDVQPFVLTTDQIDDYHIRYLGRQNADEIPCFVFAVKPKKMEQGKRYFEGQIWVDDRDFQIVKTYGKGVGLLKKGSDNQFPRFETYREQIDGRFWFPTYTIANDTLQFQTGPQPIRMTVRYEDYKRFEGRATIEFGDVIEDAPEAKPEPKP